MTITFITGANKSLGYETARRLQDLGHTVLIGARDVERGQRAAEALSARFVRIDVTDDDSVAAAVSDVQAHEGHLDVLINNAGIPGRRAPTPELTAQDALLVFDTNVVSIVRVSNAFLPLLRLSASPTIVNVSSGMGSFAATQDPNRNESQVVTPLYSASKAAVTMLTTIYARAIPDIPPSPATPPSAVRPIRRVKQFGRIFRRGRDLVPSVGKERPSGSPGGSQEPQRALR